MTISIQKQIENKEKELEVLKNNLKKELNKDSKNIIWISLDKEYEVTKDVLHKGKSFNEIMQLKKSNEELLTLKQIAMILENKELTKELKMDARYSTYDDFFFKQPCETNELNNYVARFYSVSDRSGFVLVEYPNGSGSSLGVRFVRKKEKRSKK